MPRPPRAALAAWLLLALLPVAAHAQDPAQVGQWGPLLDFPEAPVHAHLLPTGQVLFSPEFDRGDILHFWDVQTGAITRAPSVGYNAFCAGHTLLPDGRLFVSGGHVTSDYGLVNNSLFDPYANAWQRLADMRYRRWYPTVTLLPDGDVLSIGGTQTPETGTAVNPEVWDAATNTWRTLTGAALDVYYYPWMFVTRSGRLFMAGPQRTARYLDTSGTGAWTSVATNRYGATRDYGSAAMYDEGKVLIVGGDDPPVSSAEVIDLNAATPAYSFTGSMRYARRQHNATLLPDGTVLVTGGSSGPGSDNENAPVRAAELWDPATGRWSLLASESEYRGYHSIALLLPDGRVLSAGGRVDARTAQVFSPPYLFKGPRPTLTQAPASVGYGERFTVTTPDAASIRKVTWLKLGSVTHAFNMSQRINHLAFSVGSGSLSVTAPANANLAPPGDYMLFILDDLGVPSVSKLVRLGGASLPPPPPPPPPPSTGIAFGSSWRYYDQAADPGAGWRTAAYDDRAWKSGAAQLGYGDGDEATVLQRFSPALASAYFRKKLSLDAAVDAATLNVRFDDGVAVFVNGTQVLARNVAAGLGHTTYASAGSSDNALASTPVDPGVFVVGENTVAVVVKNASGTSSDLSFDLELQLTPGTGPVTPALRVTAPDGGERFTTGTQATLRWDTSGSVPEVTVEYSADDGASWTPVATHVANTGSLAWTVPDAPTSGGRIRVKDAQDGTPSDASDAAFFVEAPPPPPPPSTGIAFGETWRYDDRNVDPGPGWMAPAFDDGAWASGRAQLGFGDGDEATQLKRFSPNQPTVYFRKHLVLDRAVTAAALDVLFDDGFVVYVNGVQVASRNVGNGLGFSAWASGTSRDNESYSASLPLEPNPFVVGDNVVAVAVKNADGGSSDLSFDLALRLTLASGSEEPVMQVLSPNGGETLVAGERYDVRWVTSTDTHAVDLEYTLDGTTWLPMADMVMGTSTYAWAVPQDARSTQARVRVHAHDTASMDTSDGPFRIVAPSTTLPSIPFKSAWRFSDRNVDLGSGWRLLGYDDSAWPSGPGELGYGDGDEATVLFKPTPRQPSVYFRRTLALPGPVGGATLRVKYDDGIAVWINGTLVFSRNVDGGTAHAAWASASAENTLASTAVNPAVFTPGDNVVAVMVKQAAPDSSDLTFDLELTLTPP